MKSEPSMHDQEVPVLIIGGSLVGLTTSLLLSTYGIANVVVEKHTGTAIHPRAASFHQRTMEIFRHADMQKIIEDAAALEFVQNGAIVAVESLTGKELKYFYTSWNEGVEDLSATQRLFITQVGLEPLLRKAAAERGAVHHYGTELISLTEDADGVTAEVRSRSEEKTHTIRARYVVAADGAHSGVRQQLGIAMNGHGSSDCITIYFKADMTQMIGERNLSVIYVLNPNLLGFFRFSFDRQSGFLSIFSVKDPVTGENRDLITDLSDQRCIEYVRTALGCDANTKIVIDNIQRWEATASSAQHYSKGRVFLVGDAAHTMPPTGGWGGNTGVADAHNLAWKLAMVLKGSAEPSLLDSYDAERRPSGLMTEEQAYAIYAGRYAERATSDTKPLAAPLTAEQVELGSIYRSAAVINNGDEAYGAEEDCAVHDPREPLVPIGARAPHLNLERDRKSISTHDLFSDKFVLLAGSEGHHWREAAIAVAEKRRFPLTALTIGALGDVLGNSEAFEKMYGVSSDGAVIVRPDGIVAWRSTSQSQDAEGAITEAMTRLLGRR